MTDDVRASSQGAAAPFPSAVGVAAGSIPASPALQLAQVRVPLDQAAEALATPDESGRLPIVLLPRKASRIVTEFVVGGAVAIGIGLLLSIDLVLRSALISFGVVFVILGVFRSFLVPVPEGAQAVLLKRGRFFRTLGSGNHVLSPFVAVSHLVTTRETPFDAPATEIPTADDVRVNVDILVTFRIAEPQKFVFIISAPDFDLVCQATCQEAVRVLFRGRKLDEILDVGADAGDVLRVQIGNALAPYGIEVTRVLVTQIRPPLSFMAALEARRLASTQRSEEEEQHSLKMLRQSDREELERSLIASRRERIELEADNEVTRLERLESRIREYPNAMRWDIEHERLAVARALASNTRAMVQVGAGLDVASSLLLHTAPAEDGADGAGAAAAGTAAENDAAAGEASAATPRGRTASSSRGRPAAGGS